MKVSIEEIRSVLTSGGFQVTDHSDDELKATSEMGGHVWTIDASHQTPSMPDRWDYKLVRQGPHQTAYSGSFDNIGQLQMYLKEWFPKIVAFAILGDSKATDDELFKALTTISDPGRRGQVGEMGNRMDVAVLSDVVHRLLERVQKLEQGGARF